MERYIIGHCLSVGLDSAGAINVHAVASKLKQLLHFPGLLVSFGSPMPAAEGSCRTVGSFVSCIAGIGSCCCFRPTAGRRESVTAPSSTARWAPGSGGCLTLVLSQF